MKFDNEVDIHNRTRYVLRNLETQKFILYTNDKLIDVDNIFSATLFTHQSYAERAGSRYFYYDGEHNFISKEEWQRQHDAQNHHTKPFAGVAINKFDKKTYCVIRIVLPKPK